MQIVGLCRFCKAHCRFLPKVYVQKNKECKNDRVTRIIRAIKMSDMSDVINVSLKSNHWHVPVNPMPIFSRVRRWCRLVTSSIQPMLIGDRVLKIASRIREVDLYGSVRFTDGNASAEETVIGDTFSETGNDGFQGGGRYHLIDAFRALAMIAMVIYHFCYDLQVIYLGNGSWPQIWGNRIWQQYICWSFILIGGFVWSWGSRHWLRRGLIINLFGLLITAVTVIALPQEGIYFGVLNLIGCSIWLLKPVEYLTRCINPWIGLALSFLLFIFLYELPKGYLGLGLLHSSWRIDLSQSLYQSLIGVPVGLPPSTFASSDYFPLLPWFFLYATGHFLRRGIAGIKGAQGTLQLRIPVLSLWGRHTLLIYLLHQPFLMLILEVWHRAAA
ncbi:MAG TPA: DUF1624 domain-containing protein [Clostridiaceae bacterium]|nr:DUF1624 domain-containing protein [Clostridiaceae bacterium]